VLIPIGLDVVDEGYFANQAVRVLHGQVPYLDFDSLYTPGQLYLNAGAFVVAGGPHLLALRVVGWVGRTLLALALYWLARPLARPLWAAVPPLFALLGLDLAPAFWWPHPGWLSEAATVIAVKAVAGLPSLSTVERSRRLVLAGAITAVVFAFKQNAGVFLGMAITAFLLIQGEDVPARSSSPALRVARFGVAATMVAALVWLMRPHLDGVTAVYLLVPVPVVCIVFAFGLVSRERESLVEGIRFGVPLGLGFTAVTVAWMSVLMVAMHGRIDLLAGFVGAVDQNGLLAPLDLPGKTGAAGVFTIQIVALAFVGVARGAGRWHLPIAVGGLLAIVGATSPGEGAIRAIWDRPWTMGLGFAALLPSAAFWAGLWFARHKPRSAADWQFRWYLAAGAFALLSEYPISDVPHLAWSAGILLVVGAIILDRLQRRLATTLQLSYGSNMALSLALLVLPALAAAPVVMDARLGVILERNATDGMPRLRQRTDVSMLPALNGVRIAPDLGQELVNLVDELKRTTRPGEPIFVYPTSPLIYVLAERPNPTRFDHLYPGTIPDAELEHVVATLEQKDVQTVVVSTHMLLSPVSTEGRAIIEDYLAADFHEVWRSTQFRVLRRNSS
jgi:hypothetical protein